MRLYLVTLRAPDGSERNVVVSASTDQGASNAALKRANKGEMVAKVR